MTVSPTASRAHDELLLPNLIRTVRVFFAEASVPQKRRVHNLRSVQFPVVVVHCRLL